MVLSLQDELTHKDVWLEIFLRILTIPILVEFVGLVSNLYHGREFDFSPVRFWGIVVGLLIISPIQLYVLKWKLKG